MAQRIPEPHRCSGRRDGPEIGQSATSQELFSPPQGRGCHAGGMEMIPSPSTSVEGGEMSTSTGDLETRGFVYVVATTLAATAHALDVARALASEARKPVTVLVSRPRRLMLNSSIAHAYNLQVEDVEARDRATIDEIRGLVLSEANPAISVVETDAHRAAEFAHVLPRGATVVLAGPIHHFLETHEQVLARKLTKLGYETVFLPSQET